MSQLNRVFTAVVGFTMLIGATAILTPIPSHAQNGPSNQPPQNVSVVNTPSVSVANTPSVTIGNTPTVTVSNPIALVSGTQVQLSGTPTVLVGNQAANPVWVRDVDNPARQPFQITLRFTVPPGSRVGSASFNTPVGKRIVIEYVSADLANLPDDYQMFGSVVETYLNGQQTAHLIPAVRPVTGQLVRVYGDPDTGVTVAAYLRLPIASGVSFQYSLSGYFVDTP